jgi:hypothetical protein
MFWFAPVFMPADASCPFSPFALYFGSTTNISLPPFAGQADE